MSAKYTGANCVVIAVLRKRRHCRRDVPRRSRVIDFAVVRGNTDAATKLSDPITPFPKQQVSVCVRSVTHPVSWNFFGCAASKWVVSMRRNIGSSWTLFTLTFRINDGITLRWISPKSGLFSKRVPHYGASFTSRAISASYANITLKMRMNYSDWQRNKKI